MNSRNERKADRFDTVLLEAVDEGLLALGADARHVIYYYVERNYQVKREDIPKKVEAFHRALEGIFGPGGLCFKTLLKRFWLRFLGCRRGRV